MNDMIQDWRLWAALALMAFWIWRVVFMQSPVGLVLFATSAVLPLAGLLLMGVVWRARESEG